MAELTLLLISFPLLPSVSFFEAVEDDLIVFISTDWFDVSDLAWCIVHSSLEHGNF